MRAPEESRLFLNTARLRLEPIIPAHAEEMAAVLRDPAIYRYLPQDPPAAPTLRDRYAQWAGRVSPAGDELWLNWLIRNQSGVAVGHAQAGFRDPVNASVAYVIAPAFQRRGYAAEALGEVCAFLRDELGAREIRAWVDTRNAPSIALLTKLGFAREKFLPKADHFKGEDSDEFVFVRKTQAS